MAIQTQFRRGNTYSHSLFTGASGEITVDLDKKVAVVHDGATIGGYPLSLNSYTAAAFNQANTDFTTIATTAGYYGNGATIASFTLEANGRISQANSTLIGISASQITSGTLGVARGGTGAGTFTTNGVLLGQGTGAFTTASSSTEGHVLTINNTGVPTFAHLSGGTF
jgi:hypothetical protein